jgi:hypothetical protein
MSNMYNHKRSQSLSFKNKKLSKSNNEYLDLAATKKLKKLKLLEKQGYKLDNQFEHHRQMSRSLLKKCKSVKLSRD